MPFDPFRCFRLRSHSVSARPSIREASDEFSPERDQSRIVHVSGPMNDRKPGLGGHFVIQEHARDATDRSRESTHVALTLDEAPHPTHLERPSKKHKSTVASAHPTDPVDVPESTTKPMWIRRVTSKLNISTPPKSGSTRTLQSRPSTRTLPTDLGPPTQGPRSPRATVAVSPPNSFASKQRREAALRERGLLPPRKDLSEQEREADERLNCAPSPASLTLDGSTEAERFKANWLANRTSESSDSECGPLVPPHLQSTGSSSSPVPPPNTGNARRSGEGKADLPVAGRQSICSSVPPPLSTSSCLEVLHEEPSEQGPIPPPPLSPSDLPIIVSSPSESPTSPTLVETCAFSSHCAGSTLESQSQSSYPLFPEKENIRLPTSRGRTSDSGDRPRRTVGSSLSKLGTPSLINLRRSVAGSLRPPSSSTLASGSSSSSSQSRRTAIDPTMHSLGTILREIGDIKDTESRRLTELAFLD